MPCDYPECRGRLMFAVHSRILRTRGKAPGVDVSTSIYFPLSDAAVLSVDSPTHTHTHTHTLSDIKDVSADHSLRYAASEIKNK